ncbi:MAG: BatA domain-containing protein, partial [Candidatus Cloacimonetes bacterium]|nr:BatA domain-containing protein [Candidatus Cloacimonadota bacterium]
MFSFLNTGILAFIVAGALPLLIYLFAKKKPKKVVFSSIRFISQSSSSQRKRINIKNIL